jgi:hypothetical protein
MAYQHQEDMPGRQAVSGPLFGSRGSVGMGAMQLQTFVSPKDVGLDMRLVPQAGASVGEAKISAPRPEKTVLPVAPGGGTKTDSKADTSGGSTPTSLDELNDKMGHCFADIGNVVVPVFEENLKLKEEKAALEEKQAALEEKMAELLKTNQDLQNFVGLLGRQYVTYKEAHDAASTDEDKKKANQGVHAILKTIAANISAGEDVHEV